MLTGSGDVQRYLREKYGIKISRRTIYRWMRSGKIKSKRIIQEGKRYKYYITEQEADLSLPRFHQQGNSIDSIIVDLQMEFGLERV